MSGKQRTKAKKDERERAQLRKSSICILLRRNVRKTRNKGEKRSKGKGTAPKKFYLHPSATECPENKKQRRKKDQRERAQPRKSSICILLRRNVRKTKNKGEKDQRERVQPPKSSFCIILRRNDRKTRNKGEKRSKGKGTANKKFFLPTFSFKKK